MRKSRVISGLSFWKAPKGQYLLPRLTKISSNFKKPLKKDETFLASTKVLSCLHKVKRYRKLKKLKSFIRKKGYLDRKFRRGFRKKSKRKLKKRRKSKLRLYKIRFIIGKGLRQKNSKFWRRPSRIIRLGSWRLKKKIRKFF